MDYCARCGVELQRDVNWTKCNYDRKTNGKSNPQRTCKKCHNERSKIYYRNHRDKVIKRTAKYHKEHPDVSKKAQKKFYIKNREDIIKSRVKYNKAHRGKARKWARTYRKKHPEKSLEHYNKRKRNYGFNIIIDNYWDRDTHYHHINNNDVIPIPSEFHLLCYTGETENHRIKCEELINVLYEGFLEVENGKINFVIGD